jgi:hypothetical protein
MTALYIFESTNFDNQTCAVFISSREEDFGSLTVLNEVGYKDAGVQKFLVSCFLA